MEGAPREARGPERDLSSTQLSKRTVLDIGAWPVHRVREAELCRITECSRLGHRRRPRN